MTERFGKYELLRRIGAGGMAEVFKAKTFGPEGFVKEVVIKRILPAFSEDQDFVEMFINEARLAARLQHANIVQIFDFNQIDGVYYIAMEWVDGTDLRRVINRSRRREMPLPQCAAVHVGVETLKGLHYASTRTEEGRPLNLVHRDISPHNLLVSFAGEVKVTDFGIAKVAALASATRSGMLKGKLGYMSPEQASGVPLDARSDIFSLGIVLWELLTGVRLYRGDSEAELFAQVKRAEVPLPRSIREEIPEELERVVMRMLSPDRDDRFATAEEALEELSSHAAGDDSLAVSAYLRELMPDEAVQETGGTQLLTGAARAPEKVVQTSPPDAPTRTRGEEEQLPSADESASEEPAAQPDVAAHGDLSGSTLSGMQTVRQGPSRRHGTLAAMVGAVLLCGLLGWWLAGSFDSRTVPSAGSDRALRVESVPAGAELFVDGVAVGKTPRVLRAVPGTRLNVSVRKGRRSAERVVSVDEERVVLALAGVRPDAAATPPDAGAVSPPDARSRRRTVKRTPRAARSSRRGRKPDAGATGRREQTRAPVGWGQLDVVVSPWARVKIDGRDMGATPVLGHRIRAGRHRVDLHNPELEKHVTVPVEIRPSKKTVLRRNWD